MAAITFDKTSSQLTNVRSVKPVLINNNDSGGRVRLRQFKFVAEGAVASGSQIELAEFGPTVVILGGAITNISLSNSATADVGYTAKLTPVDTNKDDFVDGVTAASAFAPSMVVTSEKTSVFATTGVGALVAADVLEGYILYVDNT